MARLPSPLIVDIIGRDIIIEAVGNGASFIAACVAAGVPRTQAYQWIREGERVLAEQDKAIEAGEDYDIPVHLVPFTEFVTGLRDAKDRGTVEILKAVRAHVANDWRAGTWILTHSRDGEFADQAKINHAGPDGGPMQVEHMTDAEVIAAVLERADDYVKDRGIIELEQ